MLKEIIYLSNKQGKHRSDKIRGIIKTCNFRPLEQVLDYLWSFYEGMEKYGEAMTKDKFIKLNIHDKIQRLYREGSFIVAIRYYGYKINLYLLGNFYVEVFYNHKYDRIDKIEPMEKNSSREKFYADQISLPSEILGQL